MFLIFVTLSSQVNCTLFVCDLCTIPALSVSHPHSSSPLLLYASSLSHVNSRTIPSMSPILPSSSLSLHQLTISLHKLAFHVALSSVELLTEPLYPALFEEATITRTESVFMYTRSSTHQVLAMSELA